MRETVRNVYTCDGNWISGYMHTITFLNRDRRERKNKHNLQQIECTGAHCARTHTGREKNLYNSSLVSHKGVGKKSTEQAMIWNECKCRCEKYTLCTSAQLTTLNDWMTHESQPIRVWNYHVHVHWTQLNTYGS